MAGEVLYSLSLFILYVMIDEVKSMIAKGKVKNNSIDLFESGELE